MPLNERTAAFDGVGMGAGLAHGKPSERTLGRRTVASRAFNRRLICSSCTLSTFGLRFPTIPIRHNLPSICDLVNTLLKYLTISPDVLFSSQSFLMVSTYWSVNRIASPLRCVAKYTTGGTTQSKEQIGVIRGLNQGTAKGARGQTDGQCR